MPGGLTIRGLGLIVSTGILWLVGRTLGVDGLFAMAIACAVLTVCAFFVVRLSARSLSVTRHVMPTRLPFGSDAECRIEVHNASRLPAGPLYVADTVHWSLAEPPRMVIGHLPAGTTVPASYPLRGTHRGQFNAGPVEIHVTDPFGLCKQTRRFETHDEIVVYPLIEHLGSPPVGGNDRGSGASSQRRLFNTGDEFHTLREYVQGDDLRQVNWPATAKWNSMMVRQHEQAWDAEATVFVDTRDRAHHGPGLHSTLEKAMSIAASVVVQLSRSGYRTRLFTDTGRPRDFDTEIALLDRLAEANPSRELSAAPGLHNLVRSGSEGLLIAIVPAPLHEQATDGRSSLKALRTAGRHHAARQAVIVHSPGHQAQVARSTAGALSAMGWGSVTASTEEPFAPNWLRLTRKRRAPAPQTIITPSDAGT